MNIIEFPLLTMEDKKRLAKRNALCNYGLSQAALSKMAEEHRNARLIKDGHIMQEVEWRLTDLNFHRERSLFAKGAYIAAVAQFYN